MGALGIRAAAAKSCPVSPAGRHFTKRSIEPASSPHGQLCGAQRIKKKVFFVGGMDPKCASEDLKQFCTSKKGAVKKICTNSHKKRKWLLVQFFFHRPLKQGLPSH